MDTSNINSVVELLCKWGASALTRYAHVTDLDIKFMPETFIQSYILDHMGDDVTIVLETHFNELLRWCLPKAAADEVSAAISAADMGTKKIDLILFKNPHMPKAQQEVLALVESRIDELARKAKTATSSCKSCDTSTRARSASSAGGPPRLINTVCKLTGLVTDGSKGTASFTIRSYGSVRASSSHRGLANAGLDSLRRSKP
jgi:hypothetical protein